MIKFGRLVLFSTLITGINAKDKFRNVIGYMR